MPAVTFGDAELVIVSGLKVMERHEEVGVPLRRPHQVLCQRDRVQAEQVHGGAARHGPVVPAVILQAVDGCDVVGRHQALAVLGEHLAPPAIVVAQQLLAWVGGGVIQKTLGYKAYQRI